MRKLILTVILAVAFSAATVRAEELDANADRLGFSPTAETLAKGRFVFNDYELIFLQGSVGITDRVQLSLMTVAPVLEGLPVFGLASVKGRYLDEGGLKLAAIGSVSVINNGPTTGGTASLGHALTYCAGEDCRGQLNLEFDLNWGWGTGLPATSSDFIVHGGAGAAIAVSDHVRLLGELNIGGVRSADQLEFFHGVAFAYGLRFHSGDLAGDVGFAKLVDGTPDTFLLGLPIVNFSYRFGQGA